MKKIRNIIVAFLCIFAMFAAIVTNASAGIVDDTKDNTFEVVKGDDVSDSSNSDEEDVTDDTDNEDNSGYSGDDFFSDHVNLNKANKELEDSAFDSIIKKFSNYGTYILALAIIVYSAMCGRYLFSDNGENKARGYIMLFAGIVFIMLWKCGTIEALNELSS